MIPIQADRGKPTIVGAMVSSTEFKMRASGKAFKLFSSSLYTNKIAAIIRELSTNAVDAQKENGREFVPIEVTMPTDLDPTLVIKDTGCGMTLEVLTTIYSTVFESTKTDSNDFNGEMGLGSKAGIFYTDTMTVVSVSGGEKTVAVVYLNENSIPCIDVMSVEKTNERSGTTIMLGVKSDDIDSFHAEAVNIYQFFTVLPKINNLYSHYSEQLINLHTSNMKAKREGIKLSNGVVAAIRTPEQNQRGIHAFIIQSGVSYPVKQGLMSLSPFIDIIHTSLISYIFKNKTIDLYVPNGMVAFGPSREGIEYIEHNELFITECLKLLVEAIEQFYHEKFDKCKSWDELIDLFIEEGTPVDHHELINSVYSLWHSRSDVHHMMNEMRNAVNDILSSIDGMPIECTMYSKYGYIGRRKIITVLWSQADSSIPDNQIVSALIRYRRDGIRAFLFEVGSSTHVVWVDKRFSKPQVARAAFHILDTSNVYLLDVKQSEEFKSLEAIASNDDDQWVHKLTDLIKTHNIKEESLRLNKNSQAPSQIEKKVKDFINRNKKAKQFVVVVCNRNKGEWFLPNRDFTQLDESTTQMAFRWKEQRHRVDDTGTLLIDSIRDWTTLSKSSYFKDLVNKGVVVRVEDVNGRKLMKSAYKRLMMVDPKQAAYNRLVSQAPCGIKESLSITRLTCESNTMSTIRDLFPISMYARLDEKANQIEKEIDRYEDEFRQRASIIMDATRADNFIRQVMDEAVKRLIGFDEFELDITNHSH